MSLFAIADLHLSLDTDKNMDVFPGWQDYVYRIEKNWNAIVRDGDTVVVCGDISWAMSLEGAEKDFRFLNSLPGKKLLIKGNHDYFWNTKRKMEQYFNEKGFTSFEIVHNNAVVVEDIAVCGTRGWFFDEDEDSDKKILLREVGRLRTSIEAGIKTGKRPVVFLHYPPLQADARCNEIMDVLLEYQIKECYFGHIHGKGAQKAVQGEHEGILFKLVSSDYLNFTPYLVKKF